MKEINLQKSLMLGVATAATQIEGGDYQNNWYEWGEQGKIKDGGSSIIACDHWNRVEEDIDLMKKLSIETYRFSIEWSRIEPFENEWSVSGLKHYIDEIDLLLKNNILPIVTLHHFSAPIWIQRKGAFTNKKTVDYFLRFIRKVVLSLGDRVSDYIVINEPNVFVNDTYMEGKYPGGTKDHVIKYFRAAKNLIIAHVKGYELIHKLRKDNNFKGTTKVGVAHHMAYFELNTKNPFFKLSKKFINHSFHYLFLKGMIKGKLSFPFFPRRIGKKSSYADFVGINYYTRSMISPSFSPATLFGRVHYKENLSPKDRTDLDWEIYPTGLYSVVKEVYKKYKLPIYITENGIADEHDIHRERFINEHLYQIYKLIDEGINVERFYYWSLMDNLEWDDGFGPRFGLIHVDYDTQIRTIRDSGYNYKNIIEARKIKIDKETN